MLNLYHPTAKNLEHLEEIDEQRLGIHATALLKKFAARNIKSVLCCTRNMVQMKGQAREWRYRRFCVDVDNPGSTTICEMIITGKWRICSVEEEIKYMQDNCQKVEPDTLSVEPKVRLIEERRNKQVSDPAFIAKREKEIRSHHAKMADMFPASSSAAFVTIEDQLAAERAKNQALLERLTKLEELTKPPEKPIKKGGKPERVLPQVSADEVVKMVST